MHKKLLPNANAARQHLNSLNELLCKVQQIDSPTAINFFQDDDYYAVIDFGQYTYLHNTRRDLMMKIRKHLLRGLKDEKRLLEEMIAHF
jgi:hypothetical protein